MEKFVITKPQKTEIIISEDTIIINKETVINTLPFMPNSELIIDMRKVDSLAIVQPRLTSGYIRINTKGELTRPKDVRKASRDKQSILFSASEQEEALRLFDALNRALTMYQERNPIIVEQVEKEVIYEPNKVTEEVIEETITSVQPEPIQEEVNIQFSNPKYNELLELKQLLDLGLISQEDYEEKKKQILNI